MTEGLWGEEFVLPEKPKTRKILDKIEKPKRSSDTSAEKVAKSKKISFFEKVAIIKENVYRVLGKQVDNTIVIRDRETLHKYLEKAIAKGRIAVDTETNNSLDPITCQLVGLCLYVPDEKQVYVPVNHVNPDSKIRLENQVTEQEIKEELSWLMDTKIVEFIYHNAKFDYQVIKCTCGLELPIDWDTFIAAKVLDENEKSAGLKQQYIEKIDPEQEKYSIEKLFEGLFYAYLEPELFALYAATDAMMTDKLYMWQMERITLAENKGILSLYTNLELPLIKVIAEMELKGMEVDQEYAVLLSNKYHKLLDNIDNEISIELSKLKDKILAWRISPEANAKPLNKKGDGEGKSKNEQLTDPINLASPTQLAILFYDVLKCPQVSKKAPRGTGEKELEAISEKLKLKLCDLLLDRREIVKLITTYIDVIPQTAKIWPDGRVRTHFNQYGADTGRLSSGGRIAYIDAEGNQQEIGGVNFQNIPSSNREIRMLFKSRLDTKDIYDEDGCYEVKEWTEVETVSGYKYAGKLTLNDKLLVEDEIGSKKELTIINIVKKENNVFIYC